MIDCLINQIQCNRIIHQTFAIFQKITHRVISLVFKYSESGGLDNLFISRVDFKYVPLIFISDSRSTKALPLTVCPDQYSAWGLSRSIWKHRNFPIVFLGSQFQEFREVYDKL